METKLFKTKKLAEEYIHENYTNPWLHDTSITEETDCDVVDMPNLCWSGEAPAVEVIDDDGKTIAIIAWWEEGEDEYELYINNVCRGAFDNNYDAREAYSKAVEDNKYEDEPKEVMLFCNNEDITN